MSTLKLTVVGDVAPLRSATKKAESSLRQMQKTTQSVGNSMNKTFGALGLGIGLSGLVTGLKNATRAASEDRKSQGLLAVALKNTTGATTTAIAGAEAWIKKTQLSSAVLDDELRPSLAMAVRATGSLTKGQDLLEVALDVSAGTGKDLGTVTAAMSKAYNGNTGALRKLLPSIKEGTDWMGQLKNQFNGASEEAAKLDPYKRLEVIFADIQETIGTALLPTLEQFADYLASPVGQQNLKEIVNLFVEMGKAIAGVISFLIENIRIVKLVIAEVILLKAAWVVLNGIVKLYTAGVIAATTATRALKWALVTTGIGALAVILGTVAAGFLEAAEGAEEYDAALDPFEASDRFNDDSGYIPNLLGPNGEPIWALGFSTLEEYLADVKDKATKAADAIRKALDAKIEGMKKVAEKFRDAIGVSFGLFGEDEYSVFNVDYFKGKLQRMVSAAKGFASNLKQILKTPNSQPLVDELIAMGPVEGNIAAKALLASGDLKEIVALKSSLYNTGAQAGATQAAMGNATYEININKAVITAADIIREIRTLEKKTGRKYLVG